MTRGVNTGCHREWKLDVMWNRDWFSCVVKNGCHVEWNILWIETEKSKEVETACNGNCKLDVMGNGIWMFTRV